MAELEQDHSEKIKDLRRTFAELYKDNLEKRVYDERDVRRLHREDAYTMRFIYHQQFDIKKAAAQADASLRFRQEFGVNDLKESSFERWMHELGAVYYRKKDKDDQDILFFKVSRNKKDPDNVFKVKQFIAWWIDKSFSKWPDRQIVVLFDMTDVGLANVDVDLIKYQVACFSTYFPGMLAYMLIYEMPWVLNAIWKLIKNLLTAEQQKRVLFVKKSGIQQYIHADNLPVHMGGNDDDAYKFLPSEDSGIDIPQDQGDDASIDGSPILNGHVTDEDHFAAALDAATSGSSPSSTSSSHPLTTSLKQHVTGDSPEKSNSKSPSKRLFASETKTRSSDNAASTPIAASSTNPGLTSPTSSVRKRVTFSEQVDTHSAEDPPMQNTSTPKSDKSSSPSGNQATFQNSFVSIQPAENLLFQISDETRETPDNITITNTSTNGLAFKIKTTNPDSFRVRPSTGIVKPNESSEISVFLQPGFHDNVTREKFLVMLMQVDEGAKVTALSDKWRNPPKDPEQYMEHRLWCKLKTVQDTKREDTLVKCEQVLETLTKQVNEMVKNQQQLEHRISRVLGCQIVIGVVIVLMALFLMASYFFDLNPSAPQCASGSGISGGCAPYQKSWQS